MSRICFLMALVTMVFAANAEEKKTIYKYTDENGVIHYSETKLNDDYQEADLPPLSIVPSVPVVKRSTSNQSNTEQIETIETQPFMILQPTDQQNIWGSGGKLTAEVSPLTKEQESQYLIQFIIDGKKQKPSPKSTQVFDGIFRGEHTVQAALLNKLTQKQIRTSNTVTFFIHQNSKK